MMDTPQEQKQEVVLSKEEYDVIIEKLETLESHEQESRPLITTKLFWDNFAVKILTSVVSVKTWVLITILYYPFELVKKGLISGDNYTNIIIVAAPLVVGLREYSKAASASSSPKSDSSNESPASKILAVIRSKFRI